MKEDNILKALKANESELEKLTKKVHQMNTKMDSTISETDRFIAEIEKKYGIDSSVVINKQRRKHV